MAPYVSVVYSSTKRPHSLFAHWLKTRDAHADVVVISNVVNVANVAANRKTAFLVKTKPTQNDPYFVTVLSYYSNKLKRNKVTLTVSLKVAIKLETFLVKLQMHCTNSFHKKLKLSWQLQLSYLVLCSAKMTINYLRWQIDTNGKLMSMSTYVSLNPS